MAQALYSCKVSGGVKEELKAASPPAPLVKGGAGGWVCLIYINDKKYSE